ncbi:MAG: CCA tRNA nucleotidyltransferase [Phycisphaerae bacterium]
MKKHSAEDVARFIIKTLNGAGHTALLAGGCVRDMLMGATPKDFDVATDARPHRVVQLFRRTEQVGAKFGVVLVRMWGHQTEVATFRSDGTYTDGRHPDEVTFGDQIEDAKRRDFTINGMFFDVLAGRVIDHVGGQQDLEARLIRAIGDPYRRFAEDHLRMLRSVRFAARLGFEIEPQTLAAARKQAHLLPTISQERLREELKLILTDATRAAGWRWIRSTGLADHLIPGVQFSDQDAKSVADRLAELPARIGFALALAVLLRPRESKHAASICRAFTCSNDECKAVSWLLTHLPRVIEFQRLDLADLKLLMDDARFESLCHLLRADLAASSSPLAAYETLLARTQAIPADEVAPPPLVTGHDLLARNVAQGPRYTEILEALYRAQLNNKIISREAALASLDEMIEEKECS